MSPVVRLFEFAPGSATRRRSGSTKAPSSSPGTWISGPTPTTSLWISPGLAKPTDNAFIEAFNGRFRAECLNANWFLTLADAREKMKAWLRYYNEHRPQAAISYKAPIELTDPGSRTGQWPR